MSRRPEPEPEYSSHGGLARYFVEHREVGWMALIAVLIWGAISFHLSIRTARGRRAWPRRRSMRRCAQRSGGSR